MSEASTLRHNGQTVNKPGTSCLGCRRRKLKCSRESDGCQNCTKSDLPCVYPTPEVGVKRKRGPYKKDKPPRQRHLEDLVKYLEPKHPGAEVDDGASVGSSQHAKSPGREGQPSTVSHSGSHSVRSSTQLANSEDLVKDALIALTRSSAQESESRTDPGAFLAPGPTAAFSNSFSTRHPSARHIFEYWQLFITRVDPLTKVIHCPTYGKKLLDFIDDLTSLSPSQEALLFSIYYAAAATCTARECRRRFGEPQDILMKRYGHVIEAAVGESYDIPQLEAVQALVLYIIAIRRKDDGANVRALFTLAVRSAQIIGLHEDPHGKYPPFEVEFRRRLWFHLYGLESRTAEESGTRSTSIMQNRFVQLPSNLNDSDLNLQLSTMPEPREGVTDITFMLLRFELHNIVYGLWSIRKQRNNSWQSQTPLRDDQLNYLEEGKKRLHATYLVHMTKSRPLDLMCLLLVEGMLVKAQLIIDFPFGTVPTKTMPREERMNLLQASVDIIRCTYLLATDERLIDWVWHFRSFHQWHSLGIVVAELSISNNIEFVESAWQVLDPILTDWDTMYKTRKEEPAWDHVNSLIERARRMRIQRSAVTTAGYDSARNVQRQFDSSDTSINVQTIVPFHERPSPNASFETSVIPASELSNRYTSTSTPQAGSHTGESCIGTGSIGNFDMNPSPFGNMEEIDFSAFDHVFGGGSYDFLDPFGELDMAVDQTIYDPSLIGQGGG